MYSQALPVKIQLSREKKRSASKSYGRTTPTDRAGFGSVAMVEDGKMVLFHRRRVLHRAYEGPYVRRREPDVTMDFAENVKGLHRGHDWRG
jgi:hypothetical protein